MKKIFFAILIANLVLVFIQFGLSCLLATEGDQVRAMTSRQTGLAEENMLLQNDISRLSALSYVEIKAKQLGMINAQLYTLSQAAIADAHPSAP
jgi:hypothetical protein